MTHKYLLIFTIFLLAISRHVSASDSEKLPNGPGIGISVGGPTIAGGSYRQFFENNLGVQVTLGGWATSRYFDMFSGLVLFYRINEDSKRYRFYVLLSSALIWESLKKLSVLPGAGVGIEFSLYKHLLLAFDLSIASFISVNHPQPLPWFLPLPLFGAGLIYYF